jgi:hypothetical protein
LGLKTKSWGSRQDVFVDCIKKVIIDGFWLWLRCDLAWDTSCHVHFTYDFFGFKLRHDKLVIAFHIWYSQLKSCDASFFLFPFLIKVLAVWFWFSLDNFYELWQKLFNKNNL